MDLIRTALNQLKIDFSNIDEIYSGLKSDWLESNIGRTEIEFIDSFDFTKGYDIDSIDENEFTKDELESLERLSIYLGKKVSIVNWTKQDYLNRYVKDRSFGFFFFKVYKNQDFSILVKTLKDYREHYNFIFQHLSEEDKIEFKNDFCDQLTRLKQSQTQSKFIELLDIAHNSVNEHYLLNASSEIFAESIQPETPILDKIELYNHIFRDNAFVVWQSMFDDFQINESSRTDIKFMFEIMKNDGLIFPTVKQNDFLKWITNTYDGLIIEKTSNYSKTKERLVIYNKAKILLQAY